MGSDTVTITISSTHHAWYEGGVPRAGDLISRYAHLLCRAARAIGVLHAVASQPLHCDKMSLLPHILFAALLISLALGIGFDPDCQGELRRYIMRVKKRRSL